MISNDEIERLNKKNYFRSKANENEIVIKDKSSNLYNRNNKNSSKTKFPVIAQKEIINESPKVIKSSEINTNSKNEDNKLQIEQLNRKLQELENENTDMNKVITK